MVFLEHSNNNNKHNIKYFHNNNNNKFLVNKKHHKYVLHLDRINNPLSIQILILMKTKVQMRSIMNGLLWRMMMKLPLWQRMLQTSLYTLLQQHHLVVQQMMKMELQLAILICQHLNNKKLFTKITRRILKIYKIMKTLAGVIIETVMLLKR